MARFGHVANKLMFQVAGIVVVSCAGAVTYHRTAAAGLLAPDNQVEAVQAAHIGNFIPKLSLSVARSAHVAGKATFIDARFANNYADGHIEGALEHPDRRRQCRPCGDDECDPAITTAHRLLSKQGMSLRKRGSLNVGSRWIHRCKHLRRRMGGLA